MQNNKKLDTILKYVKVAFYLFLIWISLYSYFTFFHNSNNSKLGKVIDPIESDSGVLNSILDTYDNKFNIDDLKANGCDTSHLNGYSVVQIFEKEKVSFNKNDYADYSKKFKIDKGITNAYLCIVADVKDSLKTNDWNYYLYVFVNRGYMGGLVNVWYSTTNSAYYDYATSWNPSLDWRMYWLITPKTYLLNLSNLIVADSENWGYKKIRPIDQLNAGWVQRIWWFVSAWQNGIIKKFVLIYTWGNVTPSN